MSNKGYITLADGYTFDIESNNSFEIKTDAMRPVQREDIL